MTTDELTTISTKAREVVAGDIIYFADGDRLVLDVETIYSPGWGVNGTTIIWWHHEGRETFPTEYTLYRVEEVI